MTWYHTHHRCLPWRETKDPYKIWISEVILQQTRVAQGLPYYTHFLQHFPTIEKLAAAPQTAVLRLWQGLGYYSRARHLHRCAQLIVKKYGGIFPTTYKQLLALPGIGSYTAAAIASVAFNRPEAVVDGNVYRVLARVFGIYTDISTQSGKQQFAQKARQLLEVSQPGKYNQAVMEFGALCCTPKIPRCESCVFKVECVANTQKQQDVLPYKSKKIKTRNRYFTYFVLQQGKRIALYRREQKDIWRGLHDFYVVESNRITKPDRLIEKSDLLRKAAKHALAREEGKIVKHILSHQIILARFVRLFLSPHFLAKKAFRDENLIFYSATAIASLPKSALITYYLAEAGILPIQKK